MSLLTRRYYSLPQTLAWPSCCLRLSLFQVDAQFSSCGPQLLQFSNLRELHIQGSYTVYDNTDFALPSEIGRLQTLRRLVLLNLPIDFPNWIVKLTNLRYLTVRGTHLKSLPPWVSELKQLQTLRVENCDLATLPATLRQMNNLRELGFVDTGLLDFSPEQIPQNLQYLDLIGSACRTQPRLTQLQAALTGTRINA